MNLSHWLALAQGSVSRAPGAIAAVPGAEFERVQPAHGACLLPGAVALSRHGVVLPAATLSLLLR